MARVVLFTGKGGVGKTTLSAATAARAAAMGRRTLVLSADPAHSLGDVLRTPLGAQPSRVAPKLFAQEIDVSSELSRHWGDVGEFLERFFAVQGLDPLRASELAILPGMDEAVALLALEEAERSGSWDLVVLDCAPTGATTRLLALPEASRWYMERIFPLERRVIGGLAPILERTSGIPVPRRPVFDALSRLHSRLAAAGELLADRSRALLRLVANPDRMAVAETARAYASLNVFGFGVDAVMANRILPAEARGGFFAARAESEDASLDELGRSFWFLPIVEIPMERDDVSGVSRLAALGAHVYGTRDPGAPLGTGAGVRVVRNGNGFDLAVPLPAKSKKVDVFSDGDILRIETGGTARSLALPRRLAEMHPARARLAKGTLTVAFR